tara:strand:+ start:7844 stop:8263 length:420 start_codon:yes stop_codon:yes gene_type:complete
MVFKIITKIHVDLLRLFLAIIYGSWFIYIGIQHFLDPDWFEPIVPKIIGYPLFWVYISGVFEIMLGILIIIPSSRRIASVGFIVFLVVVYWANINMWINDIEIGENKLSQQGHVIRAIIQIILITVVAWIGKLKPLVRN